MIFLTFEEIYWNTKIINVKVKFVLIKDSLKAQFFPDYLVLNGKFLLFNIWLFRLPVWKCLIFSRKYRLFKNISMTYWLSKEYLYSVLCTLFPCSPHIMHFPKRRLQETQKFVSKMKMLIIPITIKSTSYKWSSKLNCMPV